MSSTPPNASPRQLASENPNPGQEKEHSEKSLQGRLGRIASASSLQLPGAIHELESFDLFSISPESSPPKTKTAAAVSRYLAVWSNSGDGDTPARLFWTTVASIDADGFRDTSPQNIEIRAVWPRDHVHHVADLRLCADGSLLTVATSDPGDSGPFASAFYIVGHFEFDGDTPRFIANKILSRLYATERHKIEALELVQGPNGGIVFGADDENHGGAVLCNW